MKQEQERLLNYEKATIHVRIVQNKCDNETNDPSSATADDDESDKSFLEVCQSIPGWSSAGAPVLGELEFYSFSLEKGSSSVHVK